MNITQIDEYDIHCPKCNFVGTFVANMNQPMWGKLNSSGDLVIEGKGTIWVDTLDCPMCGHNFDPQKVAILRDFGGYAD